MSCFWEEPWCWGGAVCIMTRPQTEWLRNCSLIPGRARELCVSHIMQTGCRANLALCLVVKEALRQEVRHPEHEAYQSFSPVMRLKMELHLYISYLSITCTRITLPLLLSLSLRRLFLYHILLILWPI
jgi:hypothetical protein